MQCQSYLPLYNSHHNLNMDDNGRLRPINGIFQNVHYNNYVTSLPVAEFLRQTILMHEGTFRNQVKELHRLYRRQKELMSEIKDKELYMNHLHFRPQWSNSFSGKLDQNALCNGGTLNNVPDREPKGKKIRRKSFDLELPAEEYIDVEEWESFKDARFSNASNSTGLCPNLPYKVVYEVDTMASSANKWLDPMMQGGFRSHSSLTQTKTNLADLNEPLTSFNLENRIPKGQVSALEVSGWNHDPLNQKNGKSDGASIGAHFEVHPGLPWRKAVIKLEENSSLIPAFPCLNNQSVDASSRSLKGSCLGSDSQESVISRPSVASDPTKHVNSLQFIDLNSTAVEETEFFSNDTLSIKTFKEVDVDRGDMVPSSCEEADNLRISKKSRLIDINLPFDTITMIDQPIIEDGFVGQDDENPSRINLNLSINDDGLTAKSSFVEKTSLEIDLEAPASPEVEERCPPRGDSEETQPEGPLHVATLEELVKKAAEAIVSLSSFKPQPCPAECESSDTGTLEWFAELVHSISYDPETEFWRPSSEDAKTLDEFEAMTLNLTEMREEEYWCQSNVQVESLHCSKPLPEQIRKGRTRRSKREDFQKEILPSLASLSRCEVTEDIQMIEGLMEAAGTPCHLSRTRRACRMGRKPRATKPECSTIDSPVLQQPKGEALIGWGKANRRPRGRRSPASPSTVLSKWHEYVI